MQNTVVS